MKIGKPKAADVDGGGFTPANLRKTKHPPLTADQLGAIRQLGEVMKHAKKLGAEPCPEHPERLKSRCGTCRARKARAAEADAADDSQTDVIEGGSR